MPDKIISYDNLTRFKDNLDQVLDDKQDALVSGENVKTVNGASILGSGDVDTNGNIAPLFSASSTYEVGDVVIYQHVLYKCITAVGTAGAWDSSKWQQTTVAELSADIVEITATGVQTDEMDAKIRNAKALMYQNMMFVKSSENLSNIEFVYNNDNDQGQVYHASLSYNVNTKSLQNTALFYSRVSSIGGKRGSVSIDSSLQTTGSSINGTIGLTGKLPYLTTAPSADNTSGFITIVVLSAEPAQRYDGFLYLILSN